MSSNRTIAAASPSLCEWSEKKTWLELHFLRLHESRVKLFQLDGSAGTFGSLGSIYLLSDTWVVLQAVLLNWTSTPVVYSLPLFPAEMAKEEPYLSFSAFENVIHAVGASRLDCRISACGPSAAISASTLVVLNAAARFLTGTKKRDHITPVLASLHRLPVHFRINFRDLLLVFKIINGSTPSYSFDPSGHFHCPLSVEQLLSAVEICSDCWVIQVHDEDLPFSKAFNSG